MLKKLLKYDLKSVFKYWWIAAVTSIGLSALGGLCISIVSSDADVPPAVALLVALAIIFSVIGIVAFSIISYVLIYVRFYKNFFTDEGYLTFTLPVKRSQLLNSKLITSVLTMFCTFAVLLADIFIMMAIGASDSFTSEIISPIAQSFDTLFYNFDAPDYIYLCLAITMIVIILIFATISSTLFLFITITFASIITKKAKVITAIGIYYVANIFISGFVQLLYLFGISALSGWVSALPENMSDPVITMILLGITLIFVLVSVLLYTLEYFMLDRKLNLN